MKTGQELELINSATGEKLIKLPFHSREETKAKLVAAGKVQAEWKKTSISHRISIIQGSMDYFRENVGTIARDITLQMGKPISQSKNEVNATIHRAEVCCRLVEDALQDITLPDIDKLQRFIKREPLGVILDIAAWNYPLLIAVNVVVPAILAGNAVAIKHSSLTPLCSIVFEDAFKHAGAPDGLVSSLIMDHHITEKVIQSGLIHHLAFTGSVGGGRKVLTSASRQFIDVGLELGGKDPAYIREDANLESSVDGVMDGVFYNGGQSCCAVERIYVHQSLLDVFVNGAIQFMNKLKIGNTLDDVTDMGPLAQMSGIKTVTKQLKDAEDKGAKIIRHQSTVPEGENFLLPAILINVNHQIPQNHLC